MIWMVFCGGILEVLGPLVECYWMRPLHLILVSWCCIRDGEMVGILNGWRDWATFPVLLWVFSSPAPLTLPLNFLFY